MFKEFKILSTLYNNQLVDFTDRVIKYNPLFDANNYIQFACRNMEKTLYKVFITELKLTNNFEDTLVGIKRIIDTKYNGINILLDNQLNMYISSYMNVVDDIYRNIYDIVDAIGIEKQTLIIEPTGDLHNNKFVCKISYLNKTYYYKPRNADLEKKFLQVLELLNPKLSYVFTPFLNISNYYKIIDRLDYSIYSDLNKVKISLETPEVNYYLLSVLCLLGCRDMHYGNFLQLGDALYPVDFETLLSPVISEIREYNQYTILTSLIFPNISRSGIDFSLFGFNLQEQNQSNFFDVKNLYTDKMDLFLNQKKVFDNKIDIKFDVNIFREIYHITYREFSQAINEIINIFSVMSDNTIVRVIFRSTYLYIKLIESMSHPSVASSIDTIKKYLYSQLINHNIMTTPIPQEVLEEEIAQLITYNVPKFDCHILSNHFTIGDVRYDFKGANCCDNLRIISSNASFECNDNMLPLIYFCVHKNYMNNKGSISNFYQYGNNYVSHMKKFCGQSQIFGPTYLSNLGRWTVSEIDNSFYGGYWGVLLSLSYVKDKITDFNLVSKIISMNSFLEHGFAGLGGALLAYNEIKNNLHKDELGQLAIFLISNLEKLALTKTKLEYEFLNGISGTIYGIFFTEVLNEKQKQYYLDRYVEIIEEKRLKHGIHGFFTEKLPFPQSGLAHGLSGISLAYMVMYLFYKEERYFKVIKECVATENKLVQNSRWPDLRPMPLNATRNNLNTWCTGSIGVILSRLLLLKFINYDGLNNLSVKDFIQVVIRNWQESKLSLCHGIISDYEVIRKLEDTYKIIILNKEDEIYFKNKVLSFNNDEIIYQPGLMNGVCGLIYYYYSKNRIFLLGL